jgi:hypothetical protein
MEDRRRPVEQIAGERIVRMRESALQSKEPEQIAGERIVRMRESALQSKEPEQIAGERIARTRESALRDKELERFHISGHAGNAPGTTAGRGGAR